MDDDRIIEQIKRLGVVEDQLKTMRDLLERAWFILEPPLTDDPHCPAEVRLEDLRHVMRELDGMVPYAAREARLRSGYRPSPPVPRRISPHDYAEEPPGFKMNGHSNGQSAGAGIGTGNGRYERV